jgi:chromosome segregation ATPase
VTVHQFSTVDISVSFLPCLYQLSFDLIRLFSFWCFPQREEKVLKLEYAVEEQTEKADRLNVEIQSQIEAKTELASQTRALRDEMDVLRERASRGAAAEHANLVFKERIARMEAEIAKREEARKRLVPVTEAEKTMATLTESIAVAREETEAYRRRASIAEDEVLRLRRKVDRLEAEKADWEREREDLVQELRHLRLLTESKPDGECSGFDRDVPLLAEIEDFGGVDDDYEELAELAKRVDVLKQVSSGEEDRQSDRQDDGFCDYDLNTSESSAGIGVPGAQGSDSDYETCGNLTPKVRYSLFTYRTVEQ